MTVVIDDDTDKEAFHWCQGRQEEAVARQVSLEEGQHAPDTPFLEQEQLAVSDSLISSFVNQQQFSISDTLVHLSWLYLSKEKHQ